jgi:hypothetical protein
VEEATWTNIDDLDCEDLIEEWKQQTKHGAITIIQAHDFQQELPCPNLLEEPNDIYYKRLLWVHNFGVYDAIKKDMRCYLWDETVAKKGGDEVLSCLWQEELDIATRYEHAILMKSTLIRWSDNCSGQNKHWKIFHWNAWLVAKRYYRRVDLKYLLSGHTYMVNDRRFAQIKKIRQNTTVNVPADYSAIVREAGQTPVPMDGQKFIDWSEIQRGFKKRKKDVNGNALDDIRSYAWYSFKWYNDKVWMRMKKDHSKDRA